MKRTTIFLDETQERELDVISEREGRPRASLVREAISDYLARRGRQGELPRFTAVGASRRRDGAANHEEEVFSGLEPHGELGHRPQPGAEPQSSGEAKPSGEAKSSAEPKSNAEPKPLAESGKKA